MHIKVPVYSKFGPKVDVNTEDGSAHCRGKDGRITWAYKGDIVTGKGIYIAGAVRSATKYIQKVLIELGYDIGHEKAGKDGSVGYHLAVIQPENCLHQVRHPLKQISSIQALLNWGFIDSIIDIQAKTLYGMMKVWYEWNKICESFCVWRYRIEELPDVWDEFLDRIGHPYTPLPEVSTRTNSLRHTDLTWDDLYKCNEELAQKIYEKHIEYGYSPERDREEPILQDSGQRKLSA